MLGLIEWSATNQSSCKVHSSSEKIFNNESFNTSIPLTFPDQDLPDKIHHSRKIPFASRLGVISRPESEPEPIIS